MRNLLCFQQEQIPHFVRDDSFSSFSAISLTSGALRLGHRLAREFRLDRAGNQPGFHAAVQQLLDGGADLILVETIFDTLNAKAALIAVFDLLEERKTEVQE